jgi:hypothetical protein
MHPFDERHPGLGPPRAQGLSGAARAKRDERFRLNARFLQRTPDCSPCRERSVADSAPDDSFRGVVAGDWRASGLATCDCPDLTVDARRFAMEFAQRRRPGSRAGWPCCPSHCSARGKAKLYTSRRGIPCVRTSQTSAVSIGGRRMPVLERVLDILPRPTNRLLAGLGLACSWSLEPGDRFFSADVHLPGVTPAAAVRPLDRAGGRRA